MWSNAPSKEKQPPQRREKSGAAASVVSEQWVKVGRLVVLLCLGVLGAAVLASPALRGRLSGVGMLFTQKSVHTLAGALRAAEGWGGVYSLLLAVVQAAALPWLPRLLPLANGMVFGASIGLLLSLAGALLGGSLCFGTARLLLRPIAARLEPPGAARWTANLGGALVCGALLCVPGASGLAGVLAGLSGLSLGRYWAGAAVGETITLLASVLCCTPYTPLLPDGARLALAGTAALVVFAALWLNWKKRGKS